MVAVSLWKCCSRTDKAIALWCYRNIIILRCHQQVLEVGAVQMVIGKLFQIQGAVELNARLANTVLSVGWDSSWWSDDWS